MVSINNYQAGCPSFTALNMPAEKELAKQCGKRIAKQMELSRPQLTRIAERHPGDINVNGCAEGINISVGGYIPHDKFETTIAKKQLKENLKAIPKDITETVQNAVYDFQRNFYM